MTEPSRAEILGICLLAGVFANLAQIALLRLFLGFFYGTELHLGTFLAVWLGGIALGGALGGRFSPPRSVVLAGLIFSPLWVLGGFPLACAYLPLQVGGFLPFFPLVLLLILLTLPLTVPVGALIPSLLAESDHGLSGVFAMESLGSFCSGLFFALVLGGNASSLLILTILPLFPLLALGFREKSGWAFWLLLVIATAGLLGTADPLEQWIFQKLWNRFHPGYQRILTRETPYQNVQIGKYEEQLSLFLDGTFAFSWPDVIRAEGVVHPFLTGIASPQQVLLLGAPPPDWLDEFQKYPDLETTIVELDETYARLLRGLATPSRRIRWETDDPRLFLQSAGGPYSGIFVVPSDPTTLLANRLFTVEAFAEMSNRLASDGVLSISISGTENYLGPTMEQVILSMHRTLLQVFPEVFAIPGDPIVFWAAKERGILATEAAPLAARLESRGIPLSTFRPASFEHLLFPFRVNQITEWLKRDTPVVINRDAQPAAFSRQVKLWDIFSGSRLGRLLNLTEQATFPRLVILIPILAMILMVVLRWCSHGLRARATLGLTASLTGITSLLAEIVLILVFQNRNGAMFQMASLFFGLFMLGLSLGSLLARRVSHPERFPLSVLKVIQICLIGWFSVSVFRPELQTAGSISLSILSLAILQGFEFILLDGRLRAEAIPGFRSAGYLFWMDNLGAVCGSLAAGLWVIPVMGLAHSLHLAALLLGANLLLLQVLPPAPVKPPASL